MIEKVTAVIADVDGTITTKSQMPLPRTVAAALAGAQVQPMLAMHGEKRTYG